MERRVPHVTSYARAPSSLLFGSAECALPTNASLFAIFARILANAPPPHVSLRTCFVCATHAHSHFCPKHWTLCHLGLYYFEFEFDNVVRFGVMPYDLQILPYFNRPILGISSCAVPKPFTCVIFILSPASALTSQVLFYVPL